MKRMSMFVAMAVAVVVGLLFSEPAKAEGWSSCGTENGGKCQGLSKQPTVIRYGDDSKGDFFYYYFSGFDTVTCGNWGGDIKSHVDKNCKSMTANHMHELPGPINAADEYTWTKCASEGEQCHIPQMSDNDITWIRYGYDDQWIYFINDRTFDCTNDISYGYDPYRHKTKECYYTTAQNPFTDVGVSDFEENQCAAESSTCNLGSNGRDVAQKMLLVRYGVDHTFTYHVTSANGFKCDNTTFYNDPVHHKEKVCQYVVFASRSGPLTASWSSLGSLNCGDTGCDKTFSISYGTTMTNSLATASSWSESFSESIKEGFSIDGVSGGVTDTLGKTWSETDTVTNTLAKTDMETMTVSCSNAKSDSGESVTEVSMYQFTSSADQYCLTTGSCSGSMQPMNVVCAANPPLGYEGPQCLPGYCANNLCTECLSPENGSSSGSDIGSSSIYAKPIS